MVSLCSIFSFAIDLVDSSKEKVISDSNDKMRSILYSLWRRMVPNFSLREEELWVAGDGSHLERRAELRLTRLTRSSVWTAVV